MFSLFSLSLGFRTIHNSEQVNSFIASNSQHFITHISLSLSQYTSQMTAYSMEQMESHQNGAELAKASSTLSKAKSLDASSNHNKDSGGSVASKSTYTSSVGRESSNLSLGMTSSGASSSILAEIRAEYGNDTTTASKGKGPMDRIKKLMGKKK